MATSTALALTRKKAVITPQALPLPLGQDLGDTAPIPPLDNVAQNPYPPLVCGVMTAKTAQSILVHTCQTHTLKGQHIKGDLMVNPDHAHTVKSCQGITTAPFKLFTACQKINTQDGVLLHNSHTATTKAFDLLNHCTAPKLSAVVHQSSCTQIRLAQSVLYHTCQTLSLTPVIHHQTCLVQTSPKTALTAHCHRFASQKSVPVPCRYYPIATPPTKETKPPCTKPPSNRLPLPFVRKTKAFKPYALPLPLACFDSVTTAPSTNITITPTQKGYVMHHTITAALDDVAIRPIAFNIKTDMASFCWQGQIEIGVEDFNAIKDTLTRPNGREPIIRVNVGDTAFAFISEETTHTQSFAKNSISLSGRSLSAHLSKDYATASPLDNVDLYASQIVTKQLENLSLTAHFGIDDYLIPKGVYSTVGKTPIGVLGDIAKACGGFLYSDPVRPIISLLPKYKTPAWQKQTADVTLAKAMIKTLATTAIKQPLYNTVTLVGQQGGIVYRSDMGQDKDAPVSDNLLYTEQTNIIKAGIAILSDSGNKVKITATLPFTHLAKLGDVWQIGEQVGVVQSVSVSASVNGAVVSVWQTVTLLGHNDD